MPRDHARPAETSPSAGITSASASTPAHHGATLASSPQATASGIVAPGGQNGKATSTLATAMPTSAAFVAAVASRREPAPSGAAKPSPATPSIACVSPTRSDPADGNARGTARRGGERRGGVRSSGAGRSMRSAAACRARARCSADGRRAGCGCSARAIAVVRPACRSGRTSASGRIAPWRSRSSSGVRERNGFAPLSAS